MAETGTNTWRDLLSVIENASFLCVYGGLVGEEREEVGKMPTFGIREMQTDSKHVMSC